MQGIRFAALLSIAVYTADVMSLGPARAQEGSPHATDTRAELKVASVSATAGTPKTHPQPHQAQIKPQTVEPSPAAGSPEDRRLVILFFDLSWLCTQEVDRAKESAQKYIDTLTGPVDTVAVMTYSKTYSVNQDFTSDRQKLREAIDRVDPQSGRGNESGLDAREMGQRVGALLALAKDLTPMPGNSSMIYIRSSLPLSGASN
jgi:hypothetical protein